MRIGYQKTLDKIKPIIKSGHVPCFTQGKYSFPCVFKNVNCLEHAIFNFSEQELKSLNLTASDRNTFSFCFSPDNDYAMKKEIFDFVQDSGLEIETSKNSPILKNQWQIALYFSYTRYGDCTDFHFLLKDESTNSWNGKDGFSSLIRRYDQAFDQLQDARTKYVKEGEYVITNPHAKTLGNS